MPQVVTGAHSDRFAFRDHSAHGPQPKPATTSLPHADSGETDDDPCRPHQNSGFRPNRLIACSSGAVMPLGLDESGDSQGRNSPEPRSALSLPFSTTTRPRLTTTIGQPVISRPS